VTARSDIDPHRLNVGEKRDRRRKRRDQPEPLPSQKADEPRTLARLKRMPASPGVMLEPVVGGWEYASPHSDKDLWEKQVAVAFGTRSTSLAVVFLRDLRKLCVKDWDDDRQQWKSNETELNAALAMVADIQPRNTQEAALAAQMVAVHWLQMRLTKQALNSGGMVMERDAALASKLARTYTMQLDALRGLRGGKRTARQSIKVSRESHHHQHIHVHRGASDSVGEPQATEGGTIYANGTGQPQERPALPSPSEVNGEVLPFPGHERAADLSAARVKGRRSEG